MLRTRTLTSTVITDSPLSHSICTVAAEEREREMERNKREYDDDDDCVVLVGRNNDKKETTFSQFNYSSGKGGTTVDTRARGDSEVEVLGPKIPRSVDMRVMGGDSWSPRSSSGTSYHSGPDGSKYRPYAADTGTAPYSGSSSSGWNNNRGSGSSSLSPQQPVNQQGPQGIRYQPGELHCTALYSTVLHCTALHCTAL
jgi:hypothetical protein